MDFLHKYNQPHTPWAALLVIKDWEIICQQVHGLASIKDNVAISTSTTFRLASVTKHFTATCILLLVERWLLQLSHTLDHFFSDTPEAWHAIQLRHLLTHTSWLHDYETIIPNNFTRQLNDYDVYDLVKEQEKLQFAPWHRFCYSNTGYCILSLVVEKASWISFWDFLHENIFKPLGMNNSMLYHNSGEWIQNRAYGYKEHNWTFIYNDQWPTTATSGDGWIYTCLDDMYKWLQALDNGTLLSKDSLQQMFAPTILWTWEIYNYGFGWEVTKYNNHIAYYHGWSSSWFKNFIYRIPDLWISAVFLSNRDTGWWEILVKEIIRHLIK